MMEALPTVILYKLNRFDLWIARPFIKAKYITLVNLLADDELMPEYLTVQDVSDELSGWASTWLDDPTCPGPGNRQSRRLAASSRPARRLPARRRPHRGLAHREHGSAPRLRLPCTAGLMNRLHAEESSWNCRTSLS